MNPPQELVMYYKICALDRTALGVRPLTASLADNAIKYITGDKVSMFLVKKNGLLFPKETIIGAKRESAAAPTNKPAKIFIA